MTVKQLEERRAGQFKAETFRHKRWLYWHQTHNLVKRQEAHDLWVKAQRDRQATDRLLATARKRPTHISDRGIKFIADFEGGSEFSKDGKTFPPYWDANGNVWTIGYGHTPPDGPPVPNAKTRPLSPGEALSLLGHDIAHLYEPDVLAAFKRYKITPTQGMLDATDSAVFNLGVGILDRGRSFGDALASGDKRAAAASLMVYVKDANGQTLLGLERRRRAERDLFLS